MTKNLTPLDSAALASRSDLTRAFQEEMRQQALLEQGINLVRGEFSRLNIDFDPHQTLNCLTLTRLPEGPAISISLYDLDSLKDPRLTSTLEAFMDWGDPAVSQNDWTTTPDQTFRFQKHFDAQNLTVVVYVRGSVSRFSKTCRKVQVGTEVVEKPKYEIICE